MQRRRLQAAGSFLQVRLIDRPCHTTEHLPLPVQTCQACSRLALLLPIIRVYPRTPVKVWRPCHCGKRQRFYACCYNKGVGWLHTNCKAPRYSQGMYSNPKAVDAMHSAVVDDMYRSCLAALIPSCGTTQSESALILQRPQRLLLRAQPQLQAPSAPSSGGCCGPPAVSAHNP